MPTPERGIDPHRQIEVAHSHLTKVLTASWDPTDWADLTLYGFYALEAAVMAAATVLGWDVRRSHPVKAQAAARLAEEHGAPDIGDLLIILNDARKATAYGDVDMPDLDPEDTAATIERFIAWADEVLRSRT